MEPYRTAGFRCPTCTESPLREFQNRFVCDECNGMLIDEEDFVASTADLVMQDLTISYRDGKPTTSTCPRCEKPLITSHAVLSPLKIGVDVLRCASDGIWIAQKQMTAVFARASRSSPGIGGPYWEAGRQTGLDGIPARGSATAGLVISNWYNRPRRRKPTATPINLYRDQRLACPECWTTELKFFGDRYACPKCTGTFVQNDALESMIMDVSKEAFDLPPPTGTAGPRACPVCSAAMIVENLEQVTIDRCAEHGVWFDPNELRVALEHASGQFEPRGVRAWLKRLF